MKTYEELKKLKTFDERLKYLQTFSKIGDTSFGGNRYLNQKFYKSEEWKRVRRDIIIRDNGCDMGLDGYDIDTKHDNIIIHHINPITYDDIIYRTHKLTDYNNLVCVRKRTHDLIHFAGDITPYVYTPRTKNDTKLW